MGDEAVGEETGSFLSKRNPRYSENLAMGECHPLIDMHALVCNNCGAEQTNSALV